MDEFQECLEEYQECLEVVQICLDGDNTFELSMDDEDLSSSMNNNHNNNYNYSNGLHTVSNNNNKFISESEAELSYKSMCEEKCEENKSSDKINVNSDLKNNHVENKKCQGNFNEDLSKSSKTVGVENNQKIHEELSSDKDGYETCIDESLSEDTCAKNEIKIDDKTPTNSNENLLAGANNFNNLQSTNVTLSDPCLLKEIFVTGNQIILDTKLDENENDDNIDNDLKCYDNQDDSLDTDEFFLVQYPHAKHEVTKCYSEPNVVKHFEKPLNYQKRLFEYYNDYADCLELYNVHPLTEDNVKTELSDSEIFKNINLTVKSSSAPDILDKTFVMLTYDPGPNKIRRRSATDFTNYTTTYSEVIWYVYLFFFDFFFVFRI